MIFQTRNIFLIFLFWSFCYASEIERQKSNREVFFLLCDTAMSDVVSADIKNYTSVYLKIANDAFTSYYHQQIIQGLITRNALIYLEQDTSEITLELSVRELSVFYGEVFSDTFFSKRKSQRKINLVLLMTLISNSNGKVISARQISKSFTDTVEYSMLDQLHDSALPMSAYKKPELSFFDSIVEPAIVTIASGVAIYLFFTIRS